MTFLYDGTYNVEYEWIIRNILNVHVMDTYFIITEGNYGAIGADDSACHGYYIISLYSFAYTFQTDLNIDVQVISSGE